VRGREFIEQDFIIAIHWGAVLIGGFGVNVGTEAGYYRQVIGVLILQQVIDALNNALMFELFQMAFGFLEKGDGRHLIQNAIASDWK
jgi:hypothetical protein